MALADFNPTELINDLVTYSCLDAYGWDNDRRQQLVTEITAAGQMASNRVAAFWRGVWFLTTQPLGYGTERSPAIWRFNPDNVAGTSIMRLNSPHGNLGMTIAQPIYFKIRDILAGVAEAIACLLKTFGMDAEFCVGQGGLYGNDRSMATAFFRGWAPGSDVDGSGAQTWEHRTPPTDTAEEQIENMLLLHRKVKDYIQGKLDGNGTPLKLDRMSNPVGTHVHIHTHTGVAQNTLLAWLAKLAILWNLKPANAEATRNRWNYSDYGRADDFREPAWGTCKAQAISMEYRAFTSPDFSDHANVEMFGDVLRCVEWIIQHTEELPPLPRGEDIPSRPYVASARVKDEVKSVIQTSAAKTITEGN